MAANKEKNAAERVHLEVSQAFNEMQEKKTRLQKSLKSVIHRTRYFPEMYLQIYLFYTHVKVYIHLTLSYELMGIQQKGSVQLYEYFNMHSLYQLLL